MKAISVFEVTGPVDQNGGYGGTKSYGFYFHHDMAYNVANDKGAWGAPGYVNMVHGYLLEIDGMTKFVNTKDFHDVLSEPPEDVIARAKAKLTEEELVALGLK